MKKLKFLIPVTAFVMAAGLAFASENWSEPVINKFVQLPGECKAVPQAECNNQGALCTYQGLQVYAIRNSATQCSVELRHQP